MKRMCGRTVYALLLQLLVVAQALCQVPAKEPDRSAYLALVQDLFDEVMTMDAVMEPAAERSRFIADLKRSLLDPSAPNPSSIPGKSWTGIWPPAQIEGPAVASEGSPNDRVLIAPKQPDTSTHSLKDLRLYVDQRLGKSAARSLVSGQAVGIVYGGEIGSALNDLRVPSARAIRIPSFYESWGISKVFVPSSEFADGRPRVIFVVPPSVQYLEHYATMMKSINAHVDRVVLDRRDQISYRVKLRKSLAQINSRLNANPDYVVLGYYNQWLSTLASADSDWRLVEASHEASGPLALTGRVLRLKHETDGKMVKVLLLSSGLAMWGQSAAFVAEAALQLNPKGFIFMGSSGALSSSLDVYGLSVPGKFRTKGGNHPVTNFVQLAGNGSTETIGSTRVSFGAKHGNTFSPIEQDREYLTQLRNIGIDTIDVEQSLIAKAIEAHNGQQGRTTLFGAINLITDRPAHILDNSSADHDLDRVDWEKKDRARKAAVQLALRSITEAEGPRMCQVLFGGRL